MSSPQTVGNNATTGRSPAAIEIIRAVGMSNADLTIARVSSYIRSTVHGRNCRQSRRSTRSSCTQTLVAWNVLGSRTGRESGHSGFLLFSTGGSSLAVVVSMTHVCCTASFKHSYIAPKCSMGCHISVSGPSISDTWAPLQQLQQVVRRSSHT